MKPIEVHFTNNPRVEPRTEYRRAWWSLWLLHVSYPRYELMEDMVVVVVFENGDKFRAKVKKGFVCDLASIPRAFWSLYPPDGLYRYIAILHDILYRTKYWKRHVADMIFKIGMHKDVPNSVRNMFYYSVRIGGKISWMKNSRESILKYIEYIDVEMI